MFCVGIVDNDGLASDKIYFVFTERYLAGIPNTKNILHMKSYD